MLAYDLEDYNIDMRARGFLAALKEHGLPTKDCLLRNFTRDRDGFAKPDETAAVGVPAHGGSFA